jgi:phospholipase/carboxylesterase
LRLAANPAFRAATVGQEAEIWIERHGHAAADDSHTRFRLWLWDSDQGTSAPMTFELSGPSRPPAAGGKPRRLVVLLHGLGADGNDLIGLGPYWAPLLPEAEFLSPNAPFPCDAAPYGYQWFSSRDRNPAAVLAGVRAAGSILDAFLDEALARRGLGDGDMALVGFSQGTMISLFVGLRRPHAPAGILGYSGRLLAAELLAGELRSRPPVLLVHGTEDPLVPYQSLAAAEAALTAIGVPTETLTCPGIGHSIDDRGLRRGGHFLEEVLTRPTLAEAGPREPPG